MRTLKRCKHSVGVSFALVANSSATSVPTGGSTHLLGSVSLLKKICLVNSIQRKWIDLEWIVKSLHFTVRYLLFSTSYFLSLLRIECLAQLFILSLFSFNNSVLICMSNLIHKIK
jgi:hypothetical protein